jgi:hypothetical protein
MTEARVTGGVFEVGVGVKDIDRALAYWRSFGYRPGPLGTLGAGEAAALYGVASPLESLRLLHQDADHGLVRLMKWKNGAGPGLGLMALRIPGNRWAVAKTRNVQMATNHARMMKAKGEQIWFTEPISRAVGVTPDQAQPFVASFPSKSEIPIFTPEMRHVVVQRFGHDLPNFGKHNDDSLFGGSQFTQVGICVERRNMEHVEFYGTVLGLQRSPTHTYQISDFIGGMTGLQKGEELLEVDFDDVRSGPESERQLSGKLRIFIVTPRPGDGNGFAATNPGNLGFSLYTLRTHDLDGLRDKVAAGGARAVSPILTDEFGARACTFTAPDGYVWTLLDA